MVCPVKFSGTCWATHASNSFTCSAPLEAVPIASNPFAAESLEKPLFHKKMFRITVPSQGCDYSSLYQGLSRKDAECWQDSWMFNHASSF